MAAAGRVRFRDRLIESAGGCVSRGVFLSGFAFFELTRVGRLPSGDAAGAEASTAYLFLILAAFVLASISAAIAITYRNATQRLSGSGATAYAVKSAWLVQSVAVPLLTTSMLCYTGALALAGSAFFPDDDNSSNLTLIILGAFALFSILAGCFIGMAIGRTGRDTTPMPRFEPVSTTRARQAGVIADRATFIVGFAQAGIVRYDAHTPDEESLSLAFLAFISIACGSALACAITGTLLSSVASGFRRVQARDSFVLATRRLWSLVSGLFFLALVAMVVALGLAGWGADYEAQALLLAWMGVVGSIATIGGFVYVVRKAKVAALKGGNAKLSTAGSSPEEREDWVHHFTLQLRVVSGTGNQASVGAGFAFLTVIAFQDTVLGRLDASQPWSNLYLLANALAATLCLLSTLYATQLQVWLDALPMAQQKAYFARSARPLALFCGWSLECALVSYMCGFSLYGVARFSPTRWTPVVMGIVGFVACLLVFWRSQSAFHVADGTSRTGPAGADGNRKLFSYPGMASHFDCVGGAALVLAGFTYLTYHNIVPVDENAGSALAAYNAILGVSMVVALSVATFATLAVVRLKSLRADRQKELFASDMKPIAVATYGCFLAALLGTLAGPVLQAFSPAYDTELAYTLALLVPCCTGTALGVVAAVRAASVAVAAERDVQNGNTPPATTAFRPHGDLLASASPIGMQAAFIAGFVLIEIGNAGSMEGSTTWQTLYLALSSVTGGFSVLALACVAHLFTWVPYPEDDWGRDRVAEFLRTGVVAVVPWAFRGLWLALFSMQVCAGTVGFAKWGDVGARSSVTAVAAFASAAISLLLLLASTLTEASSKPSAGGPPPRRLSSTHTDEGEETQARPTAAAPRRKSDVVVRNPVSAQEVEMQTKAASSRV